MDVEDWLRRLGLERYAELFRANDIGLEVLADLTEADLTTLGVSLGDRKRLLRAIAALGGNSPPAEEAAPNSPPAGLPRTQHWSIRTINSPAFLWIMSAIAISAFGAYFADFQRCASEASQVNERFYKLRDELKYRMSAIYTTINLAKSISDLRNVDLVKDADSKFLYSDFKERRLVDLDFEYKNLLRKIDISEIEDFKTHDEDLRNDLKLPLSRALELLPISSNNFAALSDLSLDDLKDAAKYEYSHFMFVYSGVGASSMGSLCGPSTVMMRLIYGYPGVYYNPPVVKFYKLLPLRAFTPFESLGK